MTHIQHQSGKAIVAWIAIIAVVTLITLRLLPVYIEASAVGSSLKGLNSGVGGQGASVSNIRKGLAKRFEINTVTSVEPEDITITREKGVFIVDVDYEVRVPFVSNVDFIVSFVKSTEVSAN